MEEKRARTRCCPGGTQSEPQGPRSLRAGSRPGPAAVSLAAGPPRSAGKGSGKQPLGSSRGAGWLRAPQAAGEPGGVCAAQRLAPTGGSVCPKPGMVMRRRHTGGGLRVRAGDGRERTWTPACGVDPWRWGHPAQTALGPAGQSRVGGPWEARVARLCPPRPGRRVRAAAARGPADCPLEASLNLIGAPQPEGHAELGAEAPARSAGWQPRLQTEVLARGEGTPAGARTGSPASWAAAGKRPP